MKKIWGKKWLPVSLFSLSLCLMATGPDNFYKLSKNLQLFSEIFKATNELYVDKIEVNELMRTGLDSMLGDLDPYTNFFSEAQMEQLRIDVVGGWDGVGVETSQRGEDIVIKTVIENSPADSAQIRVGDVIKMVDNNPTKGKKTEQVDKILNGKEGTQVKVTVFRPSNGSSRELTLNRAKIRQKNVPYTGMLSDNETGYVVLTTFTEDAAKNVQNGFSRLQEDFKPKQFVLDLRDNGGGLLIEAVNICNVFVPKGKDIVFTRNKLKEWDRTFKTMGNALSLDIPLIVLINERSASASEIVAGALQDLDRAVLLGRKSFGKGLVQNTKDVGYNSKVKLTTAKYYIPSGRCIQALEYKDGSPVPVEDKDRKAFKTANGRLVYDGGGLLPDYKVDLPAPSAFVKAMTDAYYISDWAAKYRNSHDSIAPAKVFRLSDADFDDFAQFVAAREYKAELETEKLAKSLKANPENASLDPSLAAIQDKISSYKRQELLKNKKELLKRLEIEVVGLYYYEKGQVELRLREDEDVQAAIQLFKNKAEFNKLLNR